MDDNEGDFIGPDDEDGDGEEFDCHMMPDGSCGLAGSEECEFECPWQAALRRVRLV